MRLLRYGAPGAEKPGLLDDDGGIRDLSGVVDDIDATALDDETLARIADLDTGRLPHVDAAMRIGPCVGGVGKFVCIGLNYADHARESGAAIPSEPVVF
ncbi:MAG: ureidoglycolate lyase, partial [Woeseiaceae bacterium]